MLIRLTVENYALIDRLSLELDPHLNIITGETGAGKSILLGALGLLAGAKNDGSAIRDNARNCVIEGTFDISGLGLEPFFEEAEIDFEAETVIRRMITPSGKSRSFVNDVPVQLVQLKELCSRLIDIHSQHQNLILSSAAFRMQATDTVADCEELLAEYKVEYAKWTEAAKRLAALQSEADEAHRNEEWVRFQADELSAADLRAGEVEELEAEQAVLANADRIGETLGSVLAALDRDEEGILTQLKSAETALHHIGESYRPSAELAERLHSVALELKDINMTVAADAAKIEADPARLESVDARLATLWSLCRKHRAESVAELIALRDKYKSQLDAITFGDEEIRRLEEEVAVSNKRASALADKLHAARVKAAPLFGREIAERLTRLGMPDAVFSVEINDTGALAPNGRDEAVFVFSANGNMAPQPVERIASGGELSRVMLSLKSLLAGRLKLPTMIFDEIDTGVSGRIADAMGEIIVDLSRSMQVVNITHLPQVASKGDTHFVVFKENSRSNIRRLTDEERIVEIAKMLSGSEITDAAISQAKYLLGM